MPVGPPRRHHRNAYVIDHFVEGVEFGRHAFLPAVNNETGPDPSQHWYSSAVSVAINMRASENGSGHGVFFPRTCRGRL
jgi:hypothetical protein